jgi:Zn-dependent peptidase ImmA (M78 family)
MSAATVEQTKIIINEYRNLFPVPVGAIASRLDIQVIATNELPEGLSGSITKEDDHYYIYVNSDHSPARQRFTIAHEIAHFAEHRDHLDRLSEIKNPSKKSLNRPNDGAASVADSTERRFEQEANEYAAKLLMPEDEFKRVWDESDQLEEVTGHFGVSGEAANVRAMKLKLGYFE